MAVDLQKIMVSKAEAAVKAADAMTLVSTDTKNKALLAMADMLEKHDDVIIEANKKDMALAEEKGVKKLKVVYSQEEPRKIILPADGQAEKKGSAGRTAPGSISFVPSVAGLIIASIDPCFSCMDR